MDITLLIPTMNRPELLQIELQYYRSLAFSGRILIGDSSTKSISKQIQASLKDFSKHLDVQYRYLPGCEPGEVLRVLGEEVKTAYVAFTADDDFLVPVGMARCVEFLDQHADFVAAHGVGMIISNNEGVIDFAGPYAQPAIESLNASQRLTDHLTDYTVSLFSVHRTETWRAMFRDIPKIKDKAFASELLPCCMTSVLGKIRQLDGLYLIRQFHPKRYLLPSWFEWLTSPDWQPGYQQFNHSIAEGIARLDDIPREEAQQIVGRAFSTYLASSISSSQPKFTDEATPAWKTNLGRIPGSRQAWHALKRLAKPAGGRQATAQAESLSLPALLDPASTYHQDFIPVYNSITQPVTSTVE